MNRTHQFTNLLARSLRDPEYMYNRGSHHSVAGVLDTGPTLASIEIWVPWYFRDLKRDPPEVVCHEPWMKKGADWHNGHSMCWILPAEWRAAMSWREKPVSDIMLEGNEWLFKNVRCLVNRHYLAHLDGITEWPEEWAYWEHYEAGRRQFERERRNRDRCRR